MTCRMKSVFLLLCLGLVCDAARSIPKTPKRKITTLSGTANRLLRKEVFVRNSLAGAALSKAEQSAKDTTKDCGDVSQQAHSRVKHICHGKVDVSDALRLRPSGLGFVVMSKVSEAEAIFSQGNEQLVGGTLIRVQRFERRVTLDAEEEEREIEELQARLAAAKKEEEQQRKAAAATAQHSSDAVDHKELSRELEVLTKARMALEFKVFTLKSRYLEFPAEREGEKVVTTAFGGFWWAHFGGHFG